MGPQSTAHGAAIAVDYYSSPGAHSDYSLPDSGHGIAADTTVVAPLAVDAWVAATASHQSSPRKCPDSLVEDSSRKTKRDSWVTCRSFD